jgi:hypothetical protein
MANKITQRLIAAGASPQRAQAFAQQYMAQTAKAGIKTQDVEDAFDAELAAISQAAYPNVFRPPSIDSPEIDAYITGVYGKEKINSIRQSSFRNVAPNLLKVINTLPKDPATDNIDQYVVRNIYLYQKPIGQIKEEILAGTYTQDGTTYTINNKLLPGSANDLVDKYAGEDARQAEEEAKLKSSFLESDKYYKAQIPHPNLKYSKTTNLAEGKIDFKTHPSVARVLGEEYKKMEPVFKAQEEKVAKTKAQLQTTYGTKGPQSSAAAGIAAPPRDPLLQVEDKVFNLFIKSGANPFKDEAIRRQSLKDKSFK